MRYDPIKSFVYEHIKRYGTLVHSPLNYDKNETTENSDGRVR